jgi:hypothetical protein
MQEPGKLGNYLNAVTVVSPTEAWAVGRWNASGDPQVAESATLVEKWDGVSWRIVRSESPDPLSNELFGVASLGGRDLIAVGALHDVGATDTQPLVLVP